MILLLHTRTHSQHARATHAPGNSVRRSAGTPTGRTGCAEGHRSAARHCGGEQTRICACRSQARQDAGRSRASERDAATARSACGCDAACGPAVAAARAASAKCVLHSAARNKRDAAPRAAALAPHARRRDASRRSRPAQRAHRRGRKRWQQGQRRHRAHALDRVGVALLADLRRGALQPRRRNAAHQQCQDQQLARPHRGGSMARWSSRRVRAVQG